MVGAFDRNPARQLAELQRQVAELERRLGALAGAPTTAGPGPGVSTAFGAVSVRAVQPGFPAELTGTWNATTGYPWKQLTLSGVALGNPDVQLSGTNAVAVDGGTGLAGGTRGWMEPDPQANGWLFTPAPGGGAGITVAEVDGTPSYAGVTTLRFDQADGFVLSQPSAGVARVDLTGLAIRGGTDPASPPVAVVSGAQEITFDPASGLRTVDAAAPADQPSRRALVSIAAASATAAGAVSTGGQTFAGAKTFATSPVSVGPLGTLVWSGEPPFDPGVLGGVTFPQVSGARRSWVTAIRDYQPSSPPATCSGLAILPEGDLLLGFAGVGDTVRVVNATTGVLDTGRTGTLGPGAKANSGIVTDLGSGSFGTVTTITSPNPGSGSGSTDGVKVVITNPTTTPAIEVSLGDIRPGKVTMTSGGAADTPLQITGFAGQTAPLLKLLADGGSNLLSVGPGSCAFTTDETVYTFDKPVQAATRFRVGTTDGASATTGGLTFEGGLYTGGTFSGGSGTVTSVNLTAPAAGITVSGGPITSSGSITLALANDLAAVEGLAGTGIACRTAADTWAVRTLTAPAAGLTITNPAGVAGNPTFALANDLAAVEGLGTTGIVRRTGADAWSAGTLVSSAEFRASAALSVVGNGTNTSATVTDLTAGTDGHVLRRSGTALGFGTLASGAFANNTVAPARIAFANTTRLLGRTTAGAGQGEEIAVGSGLTLSGGTLSASGGTLDINGLTAADVARDDSLPFYDLSAAANRKVTVDRLAAFARLAPGGRLTGTSGTPVTTADVFPAVLYYTPYLHDLIPLWDGTRWVLVQFAEVLFDGLPIPLSATNYDVFGFLSSGALALEATAWTNNTTRATAVTYQDGRLCKSGDKTRLYLGTVRVNTSGQVPDEGLQRYLWNMYNRVPRPLRVFDVTDSWTYGTAAWRAANNSTGNRVEYVVGINDAPVEARVLGQGLATNAQAFQFGVGVDSTAANSAQLRQEANGAAAAATTALTAAFYRGFPGIGYHYLQWIEYARAGTPTIYGDAGTVTIQSGMEGLVWG